MLPELTSMTHEMGLTDHVIFTGFVEDEQKPLYYKSADIFCLPSTTMAESFGIVNLEAMAASIPIVSSNLGGIPDLVEHGENGLLSNRWNVKKLADNLLILLEDEDMRNKMGLEGKQRVKNYSWDKITLETEHLYRKIIENY